MKTVERHKKTDFGDVWYVNAVDGTYRFAVYKYDDDDETIYLSNVFVKEDSRRQGYGNEILTSAEDYAKRLNASVICLKVLSGSDVHRWYKRHGYEDLEKDEEERGYMWMRKVLNVTESVWTDMQDRGTGDLEKKEDEIPEQFKKVLAIYIHTFAHLEAAAGNYTVGSCSEFIAFIKDYQNKPAIAREDPDIPELVQYVRDNWDFVCDIIMKTITKVDDEVSVVVDNIIDDMKKDVNESIWSDMQERGTGDSVKTEDIDNMSFSELYRYMQKIYVCIRKYDIYYDDDSDTMTATLFSDKARGYNIFFMKSMANSRKTIYVEKNLVDALGCFDEMEDKYYLKTYDLSEDVYIDIYPDEYTEPTNRFFLEVFDYLLDKIHAPLKKHIEKKSNVNESIWSDMQERGTGDSVKKEDDVNLMDMDRFVDYLRKIYDVKNCSAPINSGNKYIILPILSYQHAYRSLLLYPEKKRAQVRRTNYEKWPEGIRDYLEDNYDVEMTLDEKKDWMYFILPKNGEEANNRFFINLIDDILAHVDEPLLERKVNESIWSDMQDRGTGDLVKKEDDVNMMDVNKFFEYLIAKYWRPEQKVNSLDKDHYSKDFETDIVVDPKHGTTIFGSYTDGELRRLMVVSNELFLHIGAKSPKNLVWTPSKPGESLNKRYYITEKNREISNKTFIDVIEFFLHNEIKESIWSDMQERGVKNVEKKEDKMSQHDLECLDQYIMNFANEVVYGQGRGEEAGNLDEFCDYIRKDNEVKDANKDRILKYVKEVWFDELCDDVSGAIEQAHKEYYQDLHESVWSDMQDRGTGDSVKTEDNVDRLDADDFVLYIKKNYKIDHTPYDAKKYADETSSEIFIPLCNSGSGSISIWGLYFEYKEGVVYVRRSISKHVPKLMNKLKTNFDLWVDEPDYEKFIIINPKDTNRKITNSYVIEVLNFIIDNLDDTVTPCIFKKTNESVWSDMQERGTGDLVRKEDEVDILDHDGFVSYLTKRYEFKNEYIDDVNNNGILIPYCTAGPRNIKLGAIYFKQDKGQVYTHDSIKEYIPELWSKLEQNFDMVPGGLDLENCTFINPKDPGRKISNTYLLEVLDFIIDNIDDSVNLCVFRKTNESVWSDMQERGTGEVGKKEDDVLNDDENRILKETSKMFKHAIRYVDDGDDYHYSDTKEDFIYYIEQRKGEMFWTGVKKPVYDKLIDYVNRNWKDDCKGIEEFTSEYIYECDGVPGGLTPADVGGMGAIYFPGPEGVPGSGDLPMPTGHVYKQIAPFDTFLKERKKKKNKKKKFRKEDEPCVHSPNAKVYDYVDDYREYVDRTYNNMDRK